MAVPNTFATKTGPIPLNELDENFSTPITIGTTSVALGSTATSIDGLDNLAYTGTLTGGTGVVAIGTSQIYKDASGNVGIGTSSPVTRLTVVSALGALTTAPATYSGDVQLNHATITSLQQVGGLEFKASTFGSGYGAKITCLDDGDLVFGDRSDSATWSERMRISSTSGNVTLQKNISVGAAAPTTVGTGITFPAAVDVSSNANTLDDYEEGTWTPTYVNFTITSGISEARYTKVGRVITANIWINATSVTCLANATFTLPIAAVSYSAGSAVSSSVVSGIQITGSTLGVVRVAITATGSLALTVTYQLAS